MNGRWLQIFERIGFPAAVVVALGLGIAKGSTWLGNEVLKPVSERHIRFLDSVESAVEQMGEHAHSQAEVLRRNTEALEALTKELAEELKREESTNSGSPDGGSVRLWHGAALPSSSVRRFG